MKIRVVPAAGLAALLLLPTACSPPYVDTYAPSRATFDVGCEPGCGLEGRQNGLVIAMTFEAGGRSYGLCCEHRAALLARLQTIRDFWCDGLDVPKTTIGGLEVGTTVSELTDQRGATIDDGQGYLTFNCGGWLEELIAKLQATSCCGSLADEAGSTGRRAHGPG